MENNEKNLQLNNGRIVQNILDNDLYKFSMSYAYMRLYPEAIGTFKFMDRAHRIKLTEKELEDFKRDLYDEFMSVPNMSIFMILWAKNTMSYIPAFYWDWLQGFSYDLVGCMHSGCIPNPENRDFKVYLDDNGYLQIEATDFLYKVTLYEVPILAFVSEYFNRKEYKDKFENWEDTKMKVHDRTIEKVIHAKEAGASFSEFGTRRRFSFDVQDEVLNTIVGVNGNTCAGTSNVYLAHLYNLRPIGTVAHEWTMFHGAMYGYRNANYMACKAWADVFVGDLGTALTDTYGSRAFFENFSLDLAKLYDGIRQDSGDEMVFTEKAFNFYKERGIDPASKLIIFSNALDFPKYISIYKKVKSLYPFKISAGIGTNLTNDVDAKPFNMVMKLMQCKMTPRERFADCIKISDDPGKHMGNDFEFEVAKKHLDL